VPEAAEMPQLSTSLMPRASPHWDKKNQPIINTLINAPFTRLNKWQFGLKCTVQTNEDTMRRDAKNKITYIL
jgi:hypothetical protein